MTRLVLFTNDYPYRAGDVVFVEKEIGALTERFDDVVVFCHARDTSGGMVDLPPGVRFGGNLFEPAPEDAPRKLIEPAPVLLLLQAAWRELWSGRLLRNARLFAMGAKVGMTQAHRTAVREAIAGDPDTVAYAFWAMGGGLALPWLRGVSARVVRVHRYDLYEERAIGGYLPFRPFLFARADRVLAISEDAAQYLDRRYPQVAGKVRLSRLGAYGPDRAPDRQPDSTRTIVSCSAVSEVKRVDRILEAVRELHALDPSRPVRWVHFGDGPLMPQLRDSARSLPSGVDVELRGQVPNAEVAAFYETGAADLFVNLSASEGVPVSIMEAIAYDVPVVATAVGGTPEIVGPALRTGELVDADASPGTVATAFAAVLEASSGSYAPRERWESEYDARRTGARAAELVSSASGGRRRRHPRS
ncbi:MULTISPECIES: glycosyltransferase [Microbacterium]|uniref:glycosyltransferase n=1 Tax=Microbacterium TaxID=33882 RepID=UPI001356CD77|nr:MULTISPECIES: glycosyltransferase [Microbacterium]